MRENADKLHNPLRKLFSVLLPVFYVVGVIAGVVFVHASEAYTWRTDNTWRLSGLFRSAESGFLSVFSGYLFDFVFVFLIVFFFGATFLGVAAIPIAVLYKGIMQGIVLSVYLAQSSDLLYLQKWITYIPAAAFGTILFLLYSIRSVNTSLHLSRALITQEHIKIHLRPNLMEAGLTLFAFTLIATTQCALEFLISILF